MIRNTRAGWGLVSRYLHWLIAVLLAVQIPLGFYMNEVYKDLTAAHSQDFSLLLQVSRLHHTNGFLLLMLTTFRLTWRVTNPTPDLPATLAAYQRALARLTHFFLYLLLFAFPLSGWATISAYEGEFPIFFFGWDHLPRLVPQGLPGYHAPYEFFKDMHKACWRLGALVLGLHVGAALWHQVVVKDTVLRRMVRGR